MLLHKQVRSRISSMKNRENSVYQKLWTHGFTLDNLYCDVNIDCFGLTLEQKPNLLKTKFG